MCTYSVIADYGRTQIPLEQWTRPVWNDYQEILKRLEALDAKLEQPDCEDPEKAAWMARVEQRLEWLEDRATP